MQRLSILILAGTLCLAAAMASAQDRSQQPAPADAAAHLSSGAIVRIDKEAAKLTIRHGPLSNLKMPAMTMVFKVGDPRMLEQVAVGDKVAFVAENVQGALTVTTLDVLK